MSPPAELELPNPAPLLHLGLAFTASRVFLTAVELDLFTHLSKRPLTASGIAHALHLHARAVPDFPDALVALGLLTRDGDGPRARYANAALAACYLVRGAPAYRGALFAMCARRSYRFWAHLPDALRTAEPQNEMHARNGGGSLWDSMYADEAKLHAFVDAMKAVSSDAHRAFASVADWKGVETHLDVGGASGQLSCEIVMAAPHVRSTTLDLERVSALARKNVAAQGLEDRVAVVSGSFWEDALPRADMVTMGQILHDYPLEKKMALLKMGYDALNPGGRFVAFEFLIDDDRRGSVAGLLMSLNMIVDQDGGFDFSAKDFDGWAKEVGFVRTERVELVPPMAAVVAYK